MKNKFKKTMSAIALALTAVSMVGCNALKGADGVQGPKGDVGPAGPTGAQGPKGDVGETGAAGKSAYQVAVDGGYTGTEAEWLASLVGAAGAAGTNGKTAFELAVEGGYTGTQAEWLASLNGAAGAAGQDGKSAFEIAVENGFTGTEADFADMLTTQYLTYGAMNKIVQNAIVDVGMDYMSGEFESEEAMRKAIEDFEPFTINIDSSKHYTPIGEELIGSGVKEGLMETEANGEFKKDANGNIVGHILFTDTLDNGEDPIEQHIDEVNLTVIDGRYFVTYECTRIIPEEVEPEVFENVEHKEINTYVEMSKYYYDILSSTIAVGAKFIAQSAVLQQNLFLPTDELFDELMKNPDQASSIIPLFSIITSFCVFTKQNGAYFAELPAILSGGQESETIGFTLDDDDKIKAIAVQASLTEGTEGNEYKEDHLLVYLLGENVEFDALAAIDPEATPYFTELDDQSGLDVEIILDEVSDPEFYNLYEVIGEISDNLGRVIQCQVLFF